MFRSLPLLLVGCGFQIDAGTSIDAAPRDGGLIDSGDPPLVDAMVDAMIDAPLPPAALCDANDPTLRACYRFDNSLTDGSSYSNGAGGTASYVSIGAHLGMSLNAPASNVTVANNASLSTSQFTVKMWVRPSSHPGGASMRTGLIDNNQLRMFVHMGGTVRCAINDGTVQVLTTATLPLNTWTRVACTYGNGALKVYFSSVEQGSVSSSNGLNGLSTGTAIGHAEPSGENFNGLIDDVQIFSAIVAP